MDAIRSIEIQTASSQQIGVDILLTSQWPKGVENGAASLVLALLTFRDK